MEASEREKPLVKDLHEHIICPLCRGYLIDATTLVECLHSFCRGCIVRRLSSGARACPVCGAATLPPLLPDLGLQRLVYLVVPGLFRSELECRRHFRLVNPQCPPLVPPLGSLDLTLDDLVSLSLRELVPGEDEESKEEEVEQVVTADKEDKEEDRVNSKEASGNEEIEEMVVMEEEDGSFGKTRYLKCPAGVTVRHLVRLLMLKRGWEDAEGKASFNRIEMIYKTSEDQKPAKEIKVLDLTWTLLDLACIFKWKREAPMKLFYRVVRKEEPTPAPRQVHCDSDGAASNDSSEVMEYIQRPPTPPPSPKQSPNVEAPSSLESNQPEASPSAVCQEVKTKKPRCEVTPVLRSPGPAESHTLDNPKTVKVARLEHHKCSRKRRNKRVIAEITTTPREDLLKLKVRLTPCPPRITSGTSNAKEKLLQMRAVRREKIKNPERTTQSLVQHSGGASLQDQDGTTKKEGAEPEETIEDIIDSIPDEVVRVAQNMNSGQIDPQEPAAEKTAALQMNEPELEKPKNEEVLRRLGLVAISEANKTLQDKMKSSQTSAGIDYHREKLERQLRESKANRVRSLLAEKQMRDALKRIMSKSKEKTGPKKGPPPLAPLTLKPSFSAPTSDCSSSSLKNETPLDLSSGANNNALDLSSCPPGSSAGASCKLRTTSSNADPTIKALLGKSSDDRKTQDSNLRTLSDAAVSLISDKSPAGVGSRLISSPAGSVAGKVALRIPQPHQRISGFGMKMKPNLGVRHIPNPQAFVASQYRNQRASFFNGSQQPP